MMKRRTRSLVAKIIAAILAVTMIIALLLPLVSNAAEHKPAYDSKYTATIPMTSLLAPALRKNTDAAGVAQQLTQALHYQTLSQWEIWDLYRNGYNIPLESIQLLAQNGEISNLVYKLAAGVEPDEADLADVYNRDYYVSHNPQIAAAVADGTLPDDHTIFLNFLRSGMQLGLQASASFNPSYYKSNYKDLQENLGDDTYNYYIHYILNGKANGRVADRLLK